MKILVIRFSSIGDIVWTTPVVRVLKTQLPDASVHFCTKKQYRAMVEPNPHIDKVHFLEDDINALVQKLKQESFDLVIDLHSNIRSRIIKWRLGKKTLTYSKHSWARWLLVQTKLNYVPQTHIADWYMDALKPLGVLPDGKGLDFFIAPENEVKLETLPTELQNGYVALVIGASEWNKRLPLPKLIELCERLTCPVALVGGKEDAEQGDLLVQAFEKNDNVFVFNACGKYNIAQSASIVQQARFTVGHDTGLTHIAAAFGRQVYAIYGGTISQYLYPYTPNRVIIENEQLACRPCSKAGKAYCPQKHFKCMQDLDFHKIATQIQ